MVLPPQDTTPKLSDRGVTKAQSSSPPSFRKLASAYRRSRCMGIFSKGSFDGPVGRDSSSSGVGVGSLSRSRIWRVPSLDDLVSALLQKPWQFQPERLSGL
jgi:hypothetical protein